MTLMDLLASRDQWTDDNTIYLVRPWNRGAEAMLVSPSPDTTEPVIRLGIRYDYFLECFIVRDFIEDFLASGERSDQEICERLIRYAIYDA